MVTWEVLDALLPQLTPTTRRTYNFSRALQGPILDMNARGVLIDLQRRDQVLREYRLEINKLSSQLNTIIRDGIGWDFEITKNRKNPWPSDTQLQHLFFNIMGLPTQWKRDARGERRPTVGREALETLEHYFYAEPIVRHLYALRELGKKISFLSTSVDADGRLRTSFNIAGTTTGRLASSYSDFGTGTNLQNVENKLRSVFVSDPGYKFCNIDLEQSDSRAVGAIHWNLFRDSKYLDACESGDLHTSVSRIAFRQLPFTGDLGGDREIASDKFYREFSYRDASKRLGHGCLTEDHEVLTKDGWVPITDKPLNILTWNDDKSEFDNVSHWEDHEYTGHLHNFEGNSISCLMTYDHRVPYKPDRRTLTTRDKPAVEGPGTVMPLGFGYVGGTTKVPARLIAAFMADGHQSSKYQISFHLLKPRKVQRLHELCQLYDYELRTGASNKYWLSENFPKHPGPFILEWTAQCIDDFIDELKHWDGHIGVTSVTISSTLRNDLEWYQTLGRIRGIGGTISKPYMSGFGSTVWRLQQNNRQWVEGKSIIHTKDVAHDVRVLCPTVPSSWFYIRRNGKISITGNTNYQGQPDKMSRATHIPIGDIVRFQNEYLGAFPAFKLWWEWVEGQIKTVQRLETFLGRQRRFFGHWRDAETIRQAIAYEPQSVTADTIDKALLSVWRTNDVQMLLQVHDSILFQFREEQEDRIVPRMLGLCEQQTSLKEGRPFTIPAEAKTGWNWSDDPSDPDSLRKFKGHDPRRRDRNPSKPYSRFDLLGVK